MSPELKRRLLDDYRAAQTPGPGRAAANWAVVETGGAPAAATGLGGAKVLALVVGVATAVAAGVLLWAALGSAEPPTPPASDAAAGPGIVASTHARPDDPSPETELAPEPDAAPGTAPTRDPALDPTPAAETPKETAPAADANSPRDQPTLRPPRSRGTPPTSTLDDEIELIAATKRALEAHRADKALRLVRQHARRFPQGRLVDERTLLQVMALCQRGQRDEAVRLRDRFLAEKPDAAISGRMRGACAPGSG